MSTAGMIAHMLRAATVVSSENLVRGLRHSAPVILRIDEMKVPAMETPLNQTKLEM
jgi:hypothetical protein